VKIFEVDSLKAAYGENTVLKDVSLQFKRGDFTGIIGPNGAGKSTFLKALVGLVKTQHGSVKFLDKNLYKYEKKELASKMSFVMQSLENIVPFTVYDFVDTGNFALKEFWQKNSIKEEKKIFEMLEKTDVLHLKDRLLTELSGGELQLVRIARALVQNSEILLLDEPIANLDLGHTRQVMDLLYQLNQEGATIITVLHNINIAADYCSKIAAFSAGEVFFDGTVDAVLTQKNITKLYEVDCTVNENVISGRPNIFILPDHLKK
jgi:iron complex transport system ATP-binding protein